MPDGPRHDDDFYAWTQYQVELLRSLPISDNRFDRDHVAEEIEDLGKSERRAVRNQVRRILEHLLKLNYSTADQPRYGWIRSILDARTELGDTLSPTLRYDLENSLPDLYRNARKAAALGLREHGETAPGDALPAECPYTLDQILADDWYPVKKGEPE